MAGDEVVILENGAEMETVTEDFSIDDAKEGGFTPDEIEMGVKQGVIKEKKAELKKEEAEETKPEAKPEAKHEDEDDIEAEHERIKNYNANEKALYFRQKKERQKRQKIEQERDFLKAQLRSFQETQQKEVEPEIEIDPEDEEKYVTVADLKKQQAAEAKKKAEQDAQQAKLNEDAQRIRDRLAEQEEEAREIDPNFDKICDLAKDVMSKQKSGRYAKELVAIAADPEGNAPEFIYEVAQLHPEYQKVKNGKSDTANAEKVTKTNNVDKIVANAQKRQSSAAVGGGGARTVSLDDLTIADVRTMSQEQWNKLPQATRDRLLRD